MTPEQVAEIRRLLIAAGPAKIILNVGTHGSIKGSIDCADSDQIAALNALFTTIVNGLPSMLDDIEALHRDQSRAAIDMPTGEWPKKGPNRRHNDAMALAGRLDAFGCAADADLVRWLDERATTLTYFEYDQFVTCGVLKYVIPQGESRKTGGWARDWADGVAAYVKEHQGEWNRRATS